MTLPVWFDNEYCFNLKIIRNRFYPRQGSLLDEFNHTHHYRIKCQILTNRLDWGREKAMPLSDPCEFGARLIEYELNQPPEDSIRNGLWIKENLFSSTIFQFQSVNVMKKFLAIINLCSRHALTARRPGCSLRQSIVKAVITYLLRCVICCACWDHTGNLYYFLAP